MIGSTSRRSAPAPTGAPPGTLPTAAAFAGTYLLIDIMRVWLPSFTTIFGSAGTTPDWIFVVFAFAWVLPTVLIIPVARRLGRMVPTTLAVLAVATRLVLQTGLTGNAQLYASSVTMLLLCAWLVAMATRGAATVPFTCGVAGAIALSAVLQLATGTVDPFWLPGAPGWVILVLAGLLLIASSAATCPDTANSAGAYWLAFGPTVLLACQLIVATGRTAAGPRWPDGWWGGALVAAGAAVGVLMSALRLPGWSRFPSAGALVALTWLASGVREHHYLPAWWPAVGCALAVALPMVLRHAAQAAAPSPLRRGLAGYAGLLALFVLVAAYNTSFDSFSGVWLPLFPLLAAALVAVAALRAPEQRSRPMHLGRVAVPSAAVLLVGAVVTAWVTAAPPVPNAATPALPLRIMTYNIRSGISAYGRFDPDRIADVIAEQQPDVVTLQEVDRGMLITGGHDTLAQLARRLGMHAYYAPANHPLFGLAILSRYPLHDVRFHRLPSTRVSPRSGVMSGVLRLAGGRDLAVMTTHMQTAAGEITSDEVRQLADRVDAASRHQHHPLVLSGDFNTPVRDPRLRPITERLDDGLAAARPLRTWPAQRPRQRLDHVFVTDTLRATDIERRKTTASDHLPIAATIHPTTQHS